MSLKLILTFDPPNPGTNLELIGLPPFPGTNLRLFFTSLEWEGEPDDIVEI